ncbi:MAG: YciI family protein [Gemmatimonadota bacterium]
MRFMLMHKSDPATEAGQLPDQELIGRVGGMIQEMARSGAFLDGAGLRQTALGARLDFVGGIRTITRGPYTGDREWTAALAIIKVASLDAAIEWATSLATAVGDARIDIRPVTEPWDLGMAPKPVDQSFIRYMLLYKADERYEGGAAPARKITDAVAALIEAMKAAGVYQTAELLQPGRHSKRVRFTNGKPTVLDGPFTESKELISGYVLLKLPSIQEAVDWAPTYAAALGDIELDIRPLFELADLA